MTNNGILCILILSEYTLEVFIMQSNANATFEKWKHKRYLILMIGVFMMMLIGIPYAWSVFNAPIAKEFSSFFPSATPIYLHHVYD